MRTIGHNNSTRLYKKGLTCVELGVVSAVWPQPDLFCQDNGDIWRVGYNFGGRNGSTLTSWFTPQGGSPIGPASTISLFSSTVDTVICRNETLCNSRLAVVSVSTFRPNLYVNTCDMMLRLRLTEIQGHLRTLWNRHYFIN
jgi:hypothetical protein